MQLTYKHDYYNFVVDIARSHSKAVAVKKIVNE